MDFWQYILESGKIVKDFILYSSNVVASEESVGIVVITLLLAFLYLALRYIQQNGQKKRAINRVSNEVEKLKDQREFAKNFNDLDTTIAAGGTNDFDRRVRRAWEEFAETLVMPDVEDEEPEVGNTVRPNFFFNSHDLGFDHGTWRYVPGIFVSVSLLLTFLGIIAAINGLKTFDDAAMKVFLDAAKSKFIMSLSGLFASILFTVLYRRQSASLEECITKLCDAIEFRVQFNTPEKIAADQLREIREQTSLLKVFGNDLGAQIGEAVSVTLTRDLAPVLDKVGNSAGAEVGGMVTELSEALNAKLNESLDEMSRTLSTINRTLVDVADKLTTSGSAIGEEMSKGIENLNTVIETARRQFEVDQEAAQVAREQNLVASQRAISDLLEAIESNTRDNTAQMNEAAENIAKAASGLSEAIVVAGTEVGIRATEAVDEMGAEANRRVTAAGTEITEGLAGVSGDFLKGLSEFQESLDASLVEPIRTMASRLESSNRELERHASAIGQAAFSHEKATESVTNSTKSLEVVAKPLADSVERIERINNAIRNSLEGSLSLMDASNSAVTASMEAMQDSIKEFKEIVDTADDLDERMGAAFEEIAAGLAQSQEQISRYSKEVSDKFGEGIQKIREVMDGINEFQPARQGG